jgi:hypothetical protein
VSRRLTSRTIRSTFRDVVYVGKHPQDNHTHGVCAAERSSAAPFAKQFARNLGLKPFIYQKSASDTTNGYEGSRTYHWVKDISITADFSEPKEHHLIIMVDVDYYLDMEEYLLALDHDNPVLMYTMLPSAVAAPQDHETAFTFNSDAELKMDINGGGHFQHKIWNWSVDELKIFSPWGFRRHPDSESALKRFFPTFTPSRLRTYYVDRRQMSDHHGVVLLTPNGKFKGDDADVLDTHLHGTTLQRLDPVDGNSLRMKVMKDGMHMSTGRVDCYNSVTLPIELDEAIAAYSRTSKVGLNSPGIQSMVQGLERADALVLLEHHKNMAPAFAPTVYPVGCGVQSYQYDVSKYDGEAKTKLVAYGSPLIHECYAHSDTRANEKHAVEKRVTSLQRKAKTVRASLFVEGLISEFVDLMDCKGNLVPVGEDAVFEKQSRASQRHILNQACETGPWYKRIFKVFLKTEAHGKVKPPRIISTIPGPNKLEYSSFIYALGPLLKEFEWYAFGHTPLEQATIVAKIAANSDHIINSDLSRFDGRVSPALRQLEISFLLAAFDSQYHEDILRLHRSQYNQHAVTSLGIKYDTDTSRASGSPETSALNTIANAFMVYSAFRSTKKKGAYIPPREAYKKLGIYGGDDGVTGNVDPTAFKIATDRVGQQLEIAVIRRGEIGVEFLSRHYSPDVWFGDVNSVSDIRRQVSKLHSTHNLPANVTPVEKLIEKARSFYLTDPHTPVIGAWAKKVLELAYGPELSESFITDVLDPFASSDEKVGAPPKDASEQVKQRYAAFRTYLETVKRRLLSSVPSNGSQSHGLTVLELNAELYELKSLDPHRIRSWSSKTALENQYPNDCQNWAMVLMDRDLGDFNYPQFQKWIAGCKTLDEILAAPCFVEQVDLPVVDANCVVGDHVLDANGPVGAVSVTRDHPAPQSAVNPDWEALYKSHSNQSTRNGPDSKHESAEPIKKGNGQSTKKVGHPVKNHSKPKQRSQHLPSHRKDNPKKMLQRQHEQRMAKRNSSAAGPLGTPLDLRKRAKGAKDSHSLNNGRQTGSKSASSVRRPPSVYARKHPRPPRPSRPKPHADADRGASC